MLQIRLLGQFDVRADGKRVTISSRTAQSLLAFLALTAGTRHRREKLAGMFWPDTSDESARKNLRQELWRIRKAISTGQALTTDYLTADELTLSFSREAEYWLDVAQLEKSGSDLQSLSSSLSLYQGELLPGFYDEWILLERERLRALFDTRMEQLVELLTAAEHWSVVQEQCERWLALGDAPEPAFRALMLSHSVRGDMAGATSTYQRCVDELRDQFGVEPSAETSALYQGLLQGSAAPRRAVHVKPSSTVTFLFTDIEGSTRLLDKLGSHYAMVLGDHHEILRAAIAKWNGREVDTQGDAFFVTFTRASDAVQCAAEAQRALTGHAWPLGEFVRVRMGLHTGEPLIGSTGYVGMDVHRAARIGDAAHGGQVLLSQTTRELVLHDLPPGITIRDLGEHRLKDMKYPTPIFQLAIEGLASDFPPLRVKFSGTEAPAPGDPPFKGLDYFDEADAHLFFGRELLTAKLVGRMREVPFLSVIIGASGSGKSSLVRAGIVPALKKGEVLTDGVKPPVGSQNWQVHVITPTAHPLEALALELTRNSESVTAAATLMDDLKQDPRSLALYLARKNPDRHTLLVLDQFEELFTLCRDEFEREAFIDNLLTTIPCLSGEGKDQGDERITLILTLRADFYAHLAQYPQLRDAVASRQEYIGPMTIEELRRAIEEPARLGRWEFEAGLVDLILRDGGDEPGALPLLSHALLETWKRRAGYTLTLKGYAEAGGVHGAIAHTAEGMYQKLSPDEQRIARDIFLRLTELGEGTEDTRRRVSFEELMSSAEDPVRVREVLNALAEARLVTLGEDTAEVAHEALIREWPTLREWLNQDREGLRLHRHLTESAQEWELLEKDPGALYRGAHLAQAHEWAVLHPNALNARERAFLAASEELERKEAAEREAQRQRELEAAQKLAQAEKKRAEEQISSNRRLRQRAVYLTVAFILAGVLALAAGIFWQRTTQANKVAISRELAAAAVSNLQIDPERSVLLALQAVENSNTLEARNALRQALPELHLLFTIPAGHVGGAPGIAYSPDGTRLASLGAYGDLSVWDASTGESVYKLPEEPDQLGFTVAFSPDGKLLAAALKTKVVVLDSANGQERFSLDGNLLGKPNNEMVRIDFSPDGRHLAVANMDDLPRIWDLASRTEILSLVGHASTCDGIAYSPDGKLLATSDDTGVIKVWEASTGKELLSLAHSGNIHSVAFSPDGRKLASASEDGSLRVWDASTGDELLRLSGTAGFYGVTFMPDGKRLVAGAQDGTTKVWDAESGQQLLNLAGNTSTVISVAASPDGAHIATSGYDGNLKAWDASPGRELSTLAAHSATTWSVAYSPDGTLLASAGEDAAARIWDASTGRAVRTLPAGEGLTSLAFSPDGKRLAAGSFAGNIYFWNAETGDLLSKWAGHSYLVYSLAFSPDGNQLLTCSWDGSARLWDLGTGKELLAFADQFSGVAFSRDGKSAVTGGLDRFVHRWDITTGSELQRYSDGTKDVYDVALGPDGSLLAIGNQDGTITLWDVKSGQLLRTLSGHAGLVSHLDFNRDGTRLASASFDRLAKVWDVDTGAELFSLYGSTGNVFGVSISPDGSRLATGGVDGTVRTYTMQLAELIELARSRVTRSLTGDECQKYLHRACP